ncbi:uncharacterized protein [Heterodontus francisci]|uniref:uncharacterized protein isoform X2 n=1 Tax=Heterodontus francisci TaxID=7792 RepID=UPI00355C134C
MKRQAENTFHTTSPENNQITGNSKYSLHDASGLLYNRERYINVAESASNVKAPGLHQLDVVLTKYCVDCRLDWHWEKCLQGILSESTLPPNPYPIVASEFIKASLRVDLWQKRDEEILHQTLQFASKLIDCENYIFQVPGLEVFGLKSALCPLNPNTFQTVLGLISLMGNKNIPQRYQGFKVATGLGVNSSATWFGSLSPFLNVLELTEFYYFKGPLGCHREALQAYAKVVHSHLKELQQQLEGTLAFTVWLSKSQNWSAHNILTYPSAFIEAFAESAGNGHQTYLKVLQSSAGSSWQCLPVVKYFVLYYFGDQEESWLAFPWHDPTAVYQNIFLSKETAAFHCQRVAAVKCLIGQCYDIIPACWRMLHSVAAQLQHLNQLNETIQELLSVVKVKGIKPTGTTDGSADVLNSTEPKVLEEALLRYQRLLQVTLDNQSCPAPSSLSDIAVTRIRAVNTRDGGPGSLDLLKEVAVMCQAVSDMVVWEVHALCPEMESLLHSLDQRACTVHASITSPAPQRSGAGKGAVTPDTWESDDAAMGTNTSRGALEGW